MTDEPLDILLYGASGFIGRLVGERLVAELAGSPLRWGLAGRTRGELENARDNMGAPSDLPLLIADADDRAALNRLTVSSRLIISTVGPYQVHGSKLLAACAASGTDYVDLCGEPAWMAEMIDRHQAEAERSGARIVFSCGYDSVPFDLGVWCLQKAAIERFGVPLTDVDCRIRATRGGGFSGGTSASLQANNERDPAVATLLRDPFALCPGFEGPAQPDTDEVAHDTRVRSWLAPFVMSTINSKNVHRTNFLLDHLYGRDFRYGEMTMTGDGEGGRHKAEAVAAKAAAAADSTHAPGKGSSEAERSNGFYDILFVGSDASGRELRGAIKGDDDPGYGSTSKMIAQIALCLSETQQSAAGPGISTPAALLGTALAERLSTKVVMRFELE
jgi:short subunit dehydrogenase-like uncharacterized protein